MARKAQGPTSISLSWVELFYDLVYAATLASFALNIAWGWPGGKYSNFVQMVRERWVRGRGVLKIFPFCCS